MNAKKIFNKSRVVITVIALAVLIALAAVVAVLATEKATFNGVQVATDGYVNLRFHYTINDASVKKANVYIHDGDSGYLNGGKPFVVGLTTETVDDEKQTYFAVPLAAAQMGCDVTVVPLDENGNEIAERGSANAPTWSVKDYADKVLSDGGYSEYFAGLKAIVNYGHYASEYFGDLLVANKVVENEGIYGRNTNPIIGMTKLLREGNGPTYSVSPDHSSVISVDKITLALEDSVSIKLYFTYTGNGDVTGTSLGGNKYCHSIDNIGTNQYGEDYGEELTVLVDGNAAITVKNANVISCLEKLVASEDAKLRDLALALYNFYHWTSSSVDRAEATCSHFMHYEYVAEGVTQPVCTYCGKTVDYQISDEINYFSAPGQLLNNWAAINAVGEGGNTNRYSLTNIMSEGGVDFTRFYFASTQNQVHFANGTVGFGANGYNTLPEAGATNLLTQTGKARYMVLKVRTPGATKLQLGLHDGTASHHYSGNNRETAEIANNEWHVYVLDLNNFYKTANPDKFTSIFVVFGEKGGYADVAYMAMCDDLYEVKQLTAGESSVIANDYTWGTAADDVVHTLSSADHEVVLARFNAELDGNDVYEYTCTNFCCAEKDATITIPTSVNYYSAPGQMINNYNTAHTAGGAALGTSREVLKDIRIDEDGTVYTRVHWYDWGTVHFGNGTAALSAGGTVGGSDKTPKIVDLVKSGQGVGQYVVLKIRTSSAATNNNLVLNIVTDKLTSTDVALGSTRDKIPATDGFVTYVVDISKIMDAEATKIHIALRNSSNSISGTYTDIAYVAMCDNVAEVAGIVGANEDIQHLMDWRNGPLTNMKTTETGIVCADGCEAEARLSQKNYNTGSASVCYIAESTTYNCSNPLCDNYTVENADLARVPVSATHDLSLTEKDDNGVLTYTCAENCQNKTTTVTVPEGINYYSAPGQVVNSWGTSDTESIGGASAEGKSRPGWHDIRRELLTDIAVDENGVYTRIHLYHSAAVFLANGTVAPVGTADNDSANYRVNADSAVDALNGGLGKYAVIRLRVANNTTGTLSLGLLVKHTDGTYTRLMADRGHRSGFTNTEGFVTYVIDLTAIANYEAAAADAEYVRVFLAPKDGIAAVAGARIDLSYFALCDSHQEVISLVGENESVIYTTQWTNSSNATIQNKQSAATSSHVMTKVVNSDGSTTYKYVSDNVFCLGHEKTVSAGINYYSAPGQLVNNYACANSTDFTGEGLAANKTLLTNVLADEDGVYTRVIFAKNGSFIFANGTVDPAAQAQDAIVEELSGGLGRYIVMRLRNNGGNAIRWGFRTDDTTGNYINWSAVYRKSADNPDMTDGEFHTYVIDLGTWRTLEDSTKIQMIMGSSVTDGATFQPGVSIDIAYAANCDTLEEVSALIGDEESIIYDVKWEGGTYDATRKHGVYTNADFKKEVVGVIHECRTDTRKENEITNVGDICNSYDVVTYMCDDPECENYNVAVSTESVEILHDIQIVVNDPVYLNDESDVCYRVTTVSSCKNEGCTHSTTTTQDFSHELNDAVGDPVYANNNDAENCYTVTTTTTCSNEGCQYHRESAVSAGHSFKTVVEDPVFPEKISMSTCYTVTTAIVCEHEGCSYRKANTERTPHSFREVDGEIHINNDGSDICYTTTMGTVCDNEGCQYSDGNVFTTPHRLETVVGEPVYSQDPESDICYTVTTTVRCAYPGCNQQTETTESFGHDVEKTSTQAPGTGDVCYVKIETVSCKHDGCNIGYTESQEFGHEIEITDVADFTNSSEDVCYAQVTAASCTRADCDHSYTVSSIDIPHNHTSTVTRTYPGNDADACCIETVTAVCQNDGCQNSKVTENIHSHNLYVTEKKAFVEEKSYDVCYTVSDVTKCRNANCNYSTQSNVRSFGHSVGMPVKNGSTYSYCSNEGCTNIACMVIVPEGTNFFSVPGQLVNNWACANVSNASGSGLDKTKTLLTDVRSDVDGIYTRVHMAGAGSFILANGTIDAGSQIENKANDALDGGLGRYIVMKIRNNGCKAIRWGFRTDMVDNGVTGMHVGWTATWRTTTQDDMTDGKFHIYVIDLSDWRGLDDSTKIQMIMGGGDADQGVVAGSSIDVAYVANCDTLAEVYSVIGSEDTSSIIYDVRWNTTTYGSGYGQFTNAQFAQKAGTCGACTPDKREGSSTVGSGDVCYTVDVTTYACSNPTCPNYNRVVSVSREEVGHKLGLPEKNGTVFTYLCVNAGCKGDFVTITVPEGMNFYSAPGQVVNNWACANSPDFGTNGLGTTKTPITNIISDEDGIYTRVIFAGKGNVFITNGTVDPSAQEQGKTQDELEGGVGRYMVIKLRNNDCTAIRWGFQTNLGKNGIEWSGTYRTSAACSDLLGGEFHVYVIDLGANIDLEDAESIQIIMGAGDDDDTTSDKANVVGASFDLAYVANCNTLQDVYMLIDGEDNIVFDQRWNSGTYDSSKGYGEYTNEEFRNHFANELFASYGDGEAIKDAGIDWTVGTTFAGTMHSINSANAQTITAANLLTKLTNGTLKAGEVWKVTGQLVLTSGTYQGNGAAIIVSSGIVIKDTSNVKVENLIVDGALTITNSNTVTFDKVDIKYAGTAVTINSRSSNILFDDCRLYAQTLAIQSYANDLVLYSSYIRGENAAQLSGNNVTVQNCSVYAMNGAISITGKDIIVRENTITSGGRTGIGIAVGAGSVNALIALNDITGIQTSIEVNDTFNTSVVLNRGINLYANDNKNIYVVDNSLGGYIDLKSNNYLIVDGNDHPKDSLSHQLVDVNNTNVNGDNITNVSARVEVGANEDLLPHTNKDQFVGMDRKDTVSDASFTTAKGVNEYLNECARNSDVVIVPPGAYSVPFMSNSRGIYLDAGVSDTTIYAYGVYFEISETNVKNYSGKFLVEMYKTDNLSIYGLTLGVAIPSSGQVRVVEKYIEVNGNKYASETDIPSYYASATRTYKMTVLTDAGFYEGFTKSDKSTNNIFHTYWPETFIYDEKTGEYRMYPEENPDNYHECVMNADGTMTITIKNKGDGTGDRDWYAKDIWNRITKGTIMTCRYAYGAHSIYANHSTNLHMRDFTFYGYSSSMANVALGTDNVTYERFHNATHSESLIDEATYHKYLALEQQWGVDMEIRDEILEDGSVRYRGPASRSGSVDGFHITSTKTGYNVVSSLLEGMVDDGTNMKANSSRLHGIRDNGDGTVTIEFKDTMYSTKWSQLYTASEENRKLAVIYCHQFAAGETVFVYAPSGKVLCEAPALTDSVKISEDTYTFYGGPTDGPREYSVVAQVYSVTVSADAINWDALKVPAAIGADSNEYKYSKAAGEAGYAIGSKLYNHIVIKSGDRFYDLESCGNIVNLMPSDANGTLGGDYIDSQRMTVDNLSWNACGYTMDNVMVYNGHSRGFLIKSTDVTIKHCTFKNISYAALLIKPEVSWAESTISRRILIEKCLFDNTGYMSNHLTYKEFACITICSTSTIADEDTLPIDDITITGCRFTNNKQQNAIYINSAQNITITNNTFDDTVASYGVKHNGCAVLLETCMNIEISNNTYNYSNYNGNPNSVIWGTNYKNIFYKDENGVEHQLIPNNLP